MKISTGTAERRNNRFGTIESMNYDAFTSGLLSQIDHYIQSAVKHIKFAKTAQANDKDVRDAWYDPAAGSVIIRHTSAEKLGNIAPQIKTAAADSPIPNHWCGLALAHRLEYFQPAKELADKMMGFRKTAEDTLSSKVKSLLGWDDRYYPTNPVAAMLTTGALGAGLGYGGASLASYFLPDTWDKKKFRRGGALLGGGLAATPGAAEVFKSWLIGQPLLNGDHMKRSYRQHRDKLPETKESSLPYSMEPRISGEDLMRMTWQHPLVSKQMAPGQKALLSGAVRGATHVSGSPFFTPSDMARLTAGMGSGYGLGLIAGRVLGAVTGLTRPAQNTLANTGALAGALKATLPLIYGR